MAPSNRDSEKIGGSQMGGCIMVRDDLAQRIGSESVALSNRDFERTVGARFRIDAS